MAKKPIYDKDPNSVLYMGHRYVLAADDAEEVKDGDAEEAKKRGRPGVARIRNVEFCRPGGMRFIIDILVFDEASKIPYNGKASSKSSPKLEIRKIKSENALPQEAVMDHIPENTEEGKAVRERISKLLSTKGGKGDGLSNKKDLYYLHVDGGWYWDDSKNGLEGAKVVQSFLKLIEKDSPSLVYVYCANSRVDSIPA